MERNTKKDCIIKYLKTQFSDDTADVQRYYVMNTIKKSVKIPVCPFMDLVLTLNRYIYMLPGLYNSPQAVASSDGKRKNGHVTSPHDRSREG